MSPRSVIAPSKCHRSRRYMVTMQGCIKAKTAKNLLDIGGKLTVKNYLCHLLSSFFDITALDLCPRTDICIGPRTVVSTREKQRRATREGWEKKQESHWASKKGSNGRNTVAPRPLCLCVGLCMCVQFSNPVHVWVCQNSATLPSSSHRSRFVSLQLQVTKWHCAFMAALHGASHKPWND